MSEEVLRDKYINEKKSSRQIGEEIGAKSHTTIQRLLTKYNIEPNHNRANRPNLEKRKGYKNDKI